MPQKRIAAYQRIVENYLYDSLPPNLEGILLLQMNDAYLYRKSKRHAWSHVLKDKVYYRRDLQKNISTEDLLGICGIFEDISEDIIALNKRRVQNGQNGQNGSRILVIVTAKGYHATNGIIEGNSIPGTIEGNSIQDMSYLDMVNLPPLDDRVWTKESHNFTFLYDHPVKND